MRRVYLREDLRRWVQLIVLLWYVFFSFIIILDICPPELHTVEDEYTCVEECPVGSYSDLHEHFNEEPIIVNVCYECFENCYDCDGERKSCNLCLPLDEAEVDEVLPRMLLNV